MQNSENNALAKHACNVGA